MLWLVRHDLTILSQGQAAYNSHIACSKPTGLRRLTQRLEFQVVSDSNARHFCIDSAAAAHSSTVCLFLSAGFSHEPGTPPVAAGHHGHRRTDLRTRSSVQGMAQITVRVTRAQARRDLRLRFTPTIASRQPFNRPPMPCLRHPDLRRSEIA
ncbi:hypothetical protein EJ06DRAFT_170636 [Trichodelitschia bisporula]|uniref:Uncharacterized protein n=1 Tax=Trichodelitschia bisporula TaxID=703511 RepID=A0A6G1HLJ1_9PEZI|nr:hypothetical protein EJ06DRAFT_170636 [Trichodelitschia bisporula]